MPYATFYFGVASTGEITTNLTIAEDISEDMKTLPDNPMKQTSFSLTKGNWFTHKWWLASNVRNYAIIQGVMDILEKRGYQLKAADKDYVLMWKPLASNSNANNLN